jgi:hypothetical protein
MGWGGGRNRGEATLFFTSILEMSGQVFARGKDSRYPSNSKVSGQKSWSGLLERREKSFLPTGNRTASRNCTDYDIPDTIRVITVVFHLMAEAKPASGKVSLRYEDGNMSNTRISLIR